MKDRKLKTGSPGLRPSTACWPVNQIPGRQGTITVVFVLKNYDKLSQPDALPWTVMGFYCCLDEAVIVDTANEVRKEVSPDL